MAKLSPDQRNYLYLIEAERTGIHKPILAALHEVQGDPALEDGETGLGIAPANRIRLEQVNTLEGQVQYAANTIRSLTNNVTAQGWSGADVWLSDKGRYSDRFLQTIASGYAPPTTDTSAARLETSDFNQLLNAYLKDIATDFAGEQLPQNLDYLDRALLNLVERLPNYYAGLPYQRDALLELVRLWRKLDDREAAIASLNVSPPSNPDTDESYLDAALLQFVQRVSQNYGGYPNQREALLRLTQLWRQLDSREAAIASLANNTSPEPNLAIVDPALIAFVQRIPNSYTSRGEQRNALVEGFRLWRKLDSRSEALITLGVDPDIFAKANPSPTELADAAAQLDRALLNFIRRIPYEYDKVDHQREALLRTVQLWRNLPTREKAIQSLFTDLRQMERARRDSQDAPPKPSPIVLPRRPTRWTPKNIQIYASIIPNGNFTWAEATQGGTRMPPNQATVDAIVRIARLAQQARDRIGRPFHVTSWYRPADVNARVGGVSNSQHIVGDAIDFYCDGLTGDQLYWFLDPWWTGGLGRYTNFPYLCHIDARSYRARWLR
jgi:tetratricopeptide (TPR) repeat protein